METLTILLTLKYFLVSWVISGIIGQLSEFIPGEKLVPSLLKLLLGCPKCITFWTVLILSMNIYVAALLSLIMFIYKKIEDKINVTQL